MHNKPYPWETRIRILGTTEQMTAKIAVNELQLPITVDEFRQKFSELARIRLRDCAWLRGSVYGKNSEQIENPTFKHLTIFVLSMLFIDLLMKENSCLFFN